MNADTVFKLLSLFFRVANGIHLQLALRDSNQAMRDSARAQAQAVVLQPGEVPPPPSGDVRLDGGCGAPARFRAHTRVRIEQGAGRLTILLPEVTTESHVTLSLFGYGLIAGGLAMGVNACLPGSQAMFTASWVFAAILALLGVGFLNAESATCRIEISDDTLLMTRVMGIWLRRTARVSHSASVKVRGESQARFEMTRRQREPYYDLTIQRWLVSRRHLIACDTGVGDWITHALQEWVTDRRAPVVVTTYRSQRAQPQPRSAT